MPVVNSSRILIFVLGLAYTLGVEANPPEHRWQKSNSFLLHTITRYALIDYSKGLLEEVPQLSSENKDLLISESSNAAVAIILYEFASGSGPSTRYFYDSQPFVNTIKFGPAMQWVMQQYVGRGCKPIENLRYQFSPLLTPFKPNTWGFSVREHYRTLSKENLSQFVLGSFNAEIMNSGDSVYVHLWNRTSKKSLFLGFGKRIQRPLPFGTISQHIYLVYSKEEALRVALKSN